MKDEKFGRGPAWFEMAIWPSESALVSGEKQKSGQINIRVDKAKMQ